jgi:hypothetical protein
MVVLLPAVMELGGLAISMLTSKANYLTGDRYPHGGGWLRGRCAFVRWGTESDRVRARNEEKRERTEDMEY